MAVDTELQHLVSLFDDQDESVVEVVNRRVIGRGEGVLSEIEVLLGRERDPEMRRSILERMAYFNTEFKISELQQFADSGAHSLFEGGYLISSLVTVGLDREKFRRVFMENSVNFFGTVTGDDAKSRLAHFNRVFFRDLGYMVDDNFMQKEKNALLYEVFQNKSGNPIVLSFIYFLFAQEVGLPIYPMCFPGGFIPVYIENEDLVMFINISRNGELFEKDRLKSIMSDQGLELTEKDFKVRDEKALCIIYLESLYYLYSSQLNQEMMLTLDRALKCFGDERYLSIEEEDE